MPSVHGVNRLPLLLGMGLAGILTIALIVSADQSFAGIDGLRAVTAFAPVSEQDPPAKRPIPVLTGVLDGIRELPVFAAPAPTVAPSASDVPAPVGERAAPAGPTATPPASTAPAGPPQPAAGLTPPPSPAPSPSPVSPPASPAASPAPSTTSPPSASASPAPTLMLMTDRGSTAVVALSDLVPGDTMDRTISLQNTGTLAFRYTVSATQSASTLLWSDTARGLQLTVATSGGTVLYSGPLSGLGSLAGPTVLAPGAGETLRYTFAFPAVAPDAFQGLVQDLTLVFSATQYP
jgi:hypothetical protein